MFRAAKDLKVEDLDLKPGDILLLQIGGWVGKAVWCMQAINRDTSRWTHVAVVLNTDGHGLVFEAQPGGARLTPLSKYAKRPGAVVRHYQRVTPGGWLLSPLDPELTSDVRLEIAQTAYGMNHVGYNWGTYEYLAAYRMHIRPGWLKRRVQLDKRVICSQAADLIYSKCGVHLFADGRMPYDVTPGDLSKLT